MAEISKITTPNGSSYDLKDAAARSGLAGKIDKVTTASQGDIPEFDSSGGIVTTMWSIDDLRSKDMDNCVLAGTITGNDGVTISSNFSEAWGKVTSGIPVFLVLEDLSSSGHMVLSTMCAAYVPVEDNDPKIIGFSVPRENGVCYVDWTANAGDESDVFVDTYFEPGGMPTFNVNASLNLSTMTISDADCSLTNALSRLSNGATVCLTLGGNRGWATGAYGGESLSDSWIEFTVLIYASLGGGAHPYMLTAHWGNDGEDDTWTVTVNELAQTSELFSGDYDDLSNKPTIPTVGTLNTTASTAQSTNASESLSGSVTLHKVSKTGSYNDLLNKPTIPAAQVQTDWNATSGMGVLLNKPSNLQTTSNLVTSLSSSSTDSQYPSAKCVYDAIQSGGGGGTQELRYAIVTPTTTTSTTDSSNDTLSATLQDRAVNIVAAGSGIDYVNLTFPAQTQGYARDFFVRLVLTGSSVPAVSFSEPGGGDVEFDVDDDSWAEIDLGVNLIMFTETSQDSGSNS